MHVFFFLQVVVRIYLKIILKKTPAGGFFFFPLAGFFFPRSRPLCEAMIIANVGAELWLGAGGFVGRAVFGGVQ